MVAKDEKESLARTATVRRVRGAEDAVASGNVGSALRSVYDQTVSEDIPGDMLDLLGKLA